MAAMFVNGSGQN